MPARDENLSLELLGQLGHLVEQVSDQTDICDLEDGSICVLVDCSNDLAVLHASQMLDGARDASAEVKLRGDVLAGLTNLQRVVGETRVDSSSAGTDGSTEGISQRRDDTVKFVLALQATTTRDDALGSGEVGAIRLCEVLADPCGWAFGLGVYTLVGRG